MSLTKVTFSMIQGASANVLDFNADPSGLSDSTSAFQAALAASDIVYAPEGTYNISGLNIVGSKTICGTGKESTVIKVTTAAPSYGITLSGSRNAIKNLRIEGSSANLISTSGSSYYNDFENVAFWSCAIALNVVADFFWARFINCVFRECKQGILCTGGQRMNAVQFVACATFNSSPTAGEYAIEVHGADGMSFIACDIQNQGIYLNNCGKTTISGGYWEAYSVPALKLVGGSTNIQGIFAPSATIFDVDSAAASQMYGEGLQSNIFFPPRPTMTQPVNIFPDPTASTVNAINALSYSPTGINFTASISGGNLQLTTTNNLARSGFFIPLTTSASISIYVRWRALAGSVKIQTLNTTPSSQVASTAGDGFLTTRLAAVSNGGAPAIVFAPEGVGPTYTAEISDIYIAPSDNLFASPDGAIVSMSEVVERQLGYSTRTGGAAELAASAATDFTLGSATGLLMVKNALQTNADNVFTAEMFFVQITFSNNFIATSLSADNGVSGGCTFTVTSPSSGVVRITNTHAAATNLRYQFFGLNV